MFRENPEQVMQKHPQIISKNERKVFDVKGCWGADARSVWGDDAGTFSSHIDNELKKVKRKRNQCSFQWYGIASTQCLFVWKEAVVSHDSCFSQARAGDLATPVRNSHIDLLQVTV